MNEAVLKEKLLELHDLLSPAKMTGVLGQGTYIPSRDAGKSIEDVLANIRLEMHYMVFDVEATRRENKYLRQMLETRSRRPQEDNPDLPPLP